MSESVVLGFLLAMSGGFMDAYSYLLRDHVFANAQTGNMLLLGVNLSEGNFTQAIHYIFPIMAFILAIAITEFIHTKNNAKIHWRQVTVFIEAIALLIVAFIPLTNNILANAITSFACGIQVESFRKIHGHGIATTMCIGNVRSGTEQLIHYAQDKDPKKLSTSLLYYGMIFFFVIGAVIGNFCIDFFAEKAILFCSLVLFTVFILMFIDRERNNKKAKEEIIVIGK